MTDARFPERWLNDRRFRRLSAEEFRTFSMALLWAVANRTDGELLAEDIPYIPDVVPGHAGRLVEVGLWAPAGAGWFIVDFEGTQTSKGQLDGLDARRRQDADRQRAKRERDKAASAALGSHVIPSRDSHGTESRDDIGQARTGQDRPGQGSLPEHSEAEPANEKPGPSSSSEFFCTGCGDELVGGVCSWCGPGVSPPSGSPAVGEGLCSVAGCGGTVTEYLRREHGPVCFVHVGAVVA